MLFGKGVVLHSFFRYKIQRVKLILWIMGFGEAIMLNELLCFTRYIFNFMSGTHSSHSWKVPWILKIGVLTPICPPSSNI